MAGIAGFALATGLFIGAALAPASRLELTDATQPLPQTLTIRLANPDAASLVAPALRSARLPEPAQPGLDPKGPYLRAAADFLDLPPGELIVEQHGGATSASSTEGAGTTFTVRLPLAASRHCAAA